MSEVQVRLPRLHAGQQRRRQRIQAERARFVVTMCGRRWGKTIDGEEWIEDGALAGERCGWFAPTYKYLIEVWDSFTHRLRPVIRKSDKTERRIELLTGGIIECWTLDTPDPGRSRKYHRVVIDEAGIARGLLTIWQQAIRATLTDYAGHAWFYGTPKGRTHDFSVLFVKGEKREDGWMSHRAPTRENPYIPAIEIEAARRDMPEAAYLQEFEGVPADDGANPFGLDAIAACVGPLSTEEPAVWGWDFARAQDWTVGVALDADGRVCDVVRTQAPWDEQFSLIQSKTGQTPSAGDATSLGGDVILSTLQNRGVGMQGVPFTPKSKQELMQRLKGAIHNRQVTFPDGPIRSELETFAYEYTANGVRYEAPAGLHDDCVMALALAVYAYDRCGIGYKPALVAPDTSYRLWQPDKDSAVLIRDPEQFTDHFPGGIPGVGF